MLGVGEPGIDGSVGCDSVGEEGRERGSARSKMTTLSPGVQACFMQRAEQNINVISWHLLKRSMSATLHALQIARRLPSHGNSHR